MKKEKIILQSFELFKSIGGLSLEDKVAVLNALRENLHEYSPFKNEPVDLVRWVKQDNVKANVYNPNKVARTELELLELSIKADGYTQPIVTYLESKDMREVVDGFHRNRVGKECKEIQDRIQGYLPVVTINSERTDVSDRMAATIRHNRARGKHLVDEMSKIVVELRRRRWTYEKISKELGMDSDEVTRLAQVSGLAELFKDKDFSMSWCAVPEEIETKDEN